MLSAIAIDEDDDVVPASVDGALDPAAAAQCHRHRVRGGPQPIGQPERHSLRREDVRRLGQHIGIDV